MEPNGETSRRSTRSAKRTTHRRTEAGRILQRDRRTVGRYVVEGLLKPAVIEPDGARWFYREAVETLAANSHAGKRGGRRRRGGGDPPAGAPQQEGEYYPELRARRAPLAVTPRPP